LGGERTKREKKMKKKYPHEIPRGRLQSRSAVGLAAAAAAAAGIRGDVRRAGMRFAPSPPT